MSIQKNKIVKLCSFYVSDWHLVTMLLPYISKRLDEGYKIATIQEKDISSNIELLVEKLNLRNKNKILKVDWNKTEELKGSIIKKKLDEVGKNSIIIISNGSKKYIEEKNRKIDEFMAESIGKSSKTEIKIIDCYNILDFNENINDILDQHDKMLNTSGEKAISEVFEDYEKKKKVI